MNAKQIQFIRLIIDYVVDKGYIERTALQDDPFRTLGSISELFENNIQDVQAILSVVDKINENIEVNEGV